MIAELTLQSAAEEDSTSIASLLATCGVDRPAPCTQQAVIYTTGDLIGYAALQAQAPASFDATIAVHPSYHREGLRGILLGWAEDCAREVMPYAMPEAARVTLRTWATDARRDHTVAGFEAVLTSDFGTLYEKEIRAGE